MNETTSEQSQSNAPSIEVQNEAQRLNLQQKELELNEKRLKSWRTDNDTINGLFDLLKTPVSIAVFLLGAYFIYTNEKSVILSMGSGCEIPPALAVDLGIPKQPYLSEQPSLIEHLEMSEMDRDQLVSAIVRRDNDRAEIRRICGL